MKDLPVLFVALKPPYEVLEQRVATRRMGGKTSKDLSDEAVKRIVERLNRLRPWFYQAVYANGCYDLEIDTVKYSPEEVCKLIEGRLAAGPGTAFEHLRARYARHV
jgi:chloramphenicol 3-O-phosphotransferase